MKENIRLMVEQGNVEEELIEESAREEIKINKGVDQYLKEHGISAPPILIKIFYSGHYTAKDLTPLKALLDKADIFVPEAMNWNEKNLKGYRKISSGEFPWSQISPLASASSAKNFEIQMLRDLYGTNKKVIFVDIKNDSDLLGEIRNLIDNNERDLDRELFAGTSNLERILDKLRALEQKRARLWLTKRDEYMLSELGPRIAGLIKDDNVLLKKDKIEILMLIGSLHTGLYHKLKKNGQDRGFVTRQFGDALTVFPHSAELRRRFQFDKPISDELLLKCLLERILMTKRHGLFINDRLDSAASFSGAIRGAVEKFSSEEIKSIFKQVRQDNFEEYLDEILRRKEIA